MVVCLAPQTSRYACVVCRGQYTSSASDIQSLVSSLNGVLFTGGGADFVQPNGELTQFAAAGQAVFEQVLSLNKAGVYMPLWATCLGFEMLNFLAAGANISVLSSGFDSENLTLPLTFTSTGASSRMMTAAGVCT